MVELFSSEDNSSSEEELVKQVNTVETSKGADAGLTVGCQVVSTVNSLFLGSEGSQFASSGAPASSTSLQGGRFCKQLQQAVRHFEEAANGTFGDLAPTAPKRLMAQ